MKIGVDLVRVNRFAKIKKTNFKKWLRVFTRNEWLNAAKAGNFHERLAGIFAAKEAAMKAAGKAGADHFLDWEVRHTVSGQPKLLPKGLLTISHDGGLVIAVVILK